MKTTQRISLILFALFLATILFFTGISRKKTQAPLAQNGKLDLRQSEFTDNALFRLDGEWEFYWMRFVDYDELTTATHGLTAAVPNTWKNYMIDGRKLDGEGYATYRLHVKTSLPAGTLLSVRLYNFSSAFELSVNGKLVAHAGKVGKNAAEEIGSYQPQLAVFTIPSSDFDLLFRVSNYHHASGGFWYSAYLGTPNAVRSYHESLQLREALILGGLLLFALFYLVTFLLRRELTYTLYFSLFCFSLAIAIDTVTQFLLLRLFPGLGLHVIICIWYSSVNWVLFFYIGYLDALFPSRVLKTMKRCYLILGVIMQIAFAIVPATFYTRYAALFNFFDISALAFVVLISANDARKGKPDALANVVSIAVTLAAYIHDILFWNYVISSAGEMLYIGFVVFLIIQMIIQAKRIQAFHEQQTAAELSFLQAQIKPHFLFNTLNTFLSISRYDIEKATTLLYDFSSYLRRCFDFDGSSQFVPLCNELELARAYAAIEKARFEERVEIHFEVPDDSEVLVPRLILQPVLENAVKHGILQRIEGGCVEVRIRQEADMLLFEIQDNGVGFSVQMNSAKKASGVGLSNIRSRLWKLYRERLLIESAAGAGTTVRWRIPLKKRRGRN